MAEEKRIHRWNQRFRMNSGITIRFGIESVIQPSHPSHFIDEKEKSIIVAINSITLYRADR